MPLDWETLRSATVLAVALSLVAFLGDELRERSLRRSKLGVWEPMTYFLSVAGPCGVPGKPTRVTLLLRIHLFGHRIVGGAHEVQRHIGLVADDPAIVTGGDVEHVARTHLDHSPVAHRRRRAP